MGSSRLWWCRFVEDEKINGWVHAFVFGDVVLAEFGGPVAVDLDAGELEEQGVALFPGEGGVTDDEFVG